MRLPSHELLARFGLAVRVRIPLRISRREMREVLDERRRERRAAYLEVPL